jgi:hypothetical protein
MNLGAIKTAPSPSFGTLSPSEGERVPKDGEGGRFTIPMRGQRPGRLSTRTLSLVALRLLPRYSSPMSGTAEALLDQFRKLPPLERQEVLQEMLRLSPPPPEPLPTIRVDGGTITSEQVADALDDE